MGNEKPRAAATFRQAAARARQLEVRGLNVVAVFDGFAALTTIVIPAIIDSG